MNVAVEQLPNCLATLRVEVESDRVRKLRERIVGDYGRAVQIPGFRAGKAPRAAVERKYKKQIREELERSILRETTQEAITQKQLKVLQVASYDSVQLEENEQFSYTATLVTVPSFDLPQYRGIVVPSTPTEVSDEDVETFIREKLEEDADFQDLAEDRGAQMDDFIVVDYHGTIDGQDVHEAFPKAGVPLTKNEGFWIKMTPEAFFPGYCAALEGARPGDVREFDIVVPDDFPVEGMNGKVIHYKVTVKEIKQRTMPELTDEFAAKMLGAEGTVEDLKRTTRDVLNRMKQRDAHGTKCDVIMRYLLDAVECELPTGLVRQQTQTMLNQIVQDNQERGVSMEVLKDKEEEIVHSAARNAREKVKSTFILLRIAELEKIQVTREQIYNRVAYYASRNNMAPEKMLAELEKRGGLDRIAEQMVTEAALEFLVANATLSTFSPENAPTPVITDPAS